jgi:glycosyltransferase involved in cell wall biosynthesis
LVVTEAAACGLPIIASSAIGCIGPTDTVQENRNGLVYPCGDVSALQRSIERLMASPELCRQMTLASREIAATQDVSVAAQAIEEAVLGAQSDVK